MSIKFLFVWFWRNRNNRKIDDKEMRKKLERSNYVLGKGVDPKKKAWAKIEELNEIRGRKKAHDIHSFLPYANSAVLEEIEKWLKDEHLDYDIEHVADKSTGVEFDRVHIFQPVSDGEAMDLMRMVSAKNGESIKATPIKKIRLDIVPEEFSERYLRNSDKYMKQD